MLSNIASEEDFCLGFACIYFPRAAHNDEHLVQYNDYIVTV